MIEHINGKKVVVLGLAKSGVAVAKLLHRFGAAIVANDRKPREEAQGADELERLGIQVITGSQPAELITPDVVLVVKNPGIPYDTPPVQQALSLGIPVITEVEIAYLLSRAPIIGITGSNGKTTTTTLVGKMLEAAGYDAVVGGNIGTVLCELTESLSEEQIVVAELSSFQLMGTQSFRPRIGALLNLYDAHLDYHHTRDEYFSAKRKLFANQTAEDFAVLPYDQEELRALSNQLDGQVYFFSRTQAVPRGIYVENGKVYFTDGQGTVEEVMDVEQIALPGDFNVENVLAALLICKLAGAPFAATARIASTFTGVEHRLEYVATVNGVRYYNNSKATNPEAAIRSMQAFRDPIVLIAGGLDRGVDFREMVPIMREKVKGIVAIGQTAELLLARAAEAGIEQRVHADTVEQAVRAAADIAAPGDVVLLSPACASWDMFPSFEVRGSMFKESVHRLETSLD